MPPKLGIIAGGGELPVQIIKSCRASGRPFFVLAFEGHTPPDTVENTPHAWVRLGAAGKALKILREEKVEELVLAGPIRRPSLSELKPDLWAMRFLSRVGTRALGGDDGLLGALVEDLEANEGFRVVGAESLISGVLTPQGVLGSVQPDEQAMRDIQRGIEVIRAYGSADVGQGAIVQQGLVLAVEAIEGTDAMLARAGQLRREGPGGVLVKLSKPGQERRADLPTVGEETVQGAAAAGLRGIAAEAERTLIIDRARVVAAADRLGLFIIGVVQDRFR